MNTQDIVDAWRREAIQEGRAEGRAEARAHDVLTVLRVRGIAVSTAARKRILAETDLQCLERWLEKAGVATTLGEVIDDRAAGPSSKTAGSRLTGDAADADRSEYLFSGKRTGTMIATRSGRCHHTWIMSTQDTVETWRREAIQEGVEHGSPVRCSPSSASWHRRIGCCSQAHPGRDRPAAPGALARKSRRRHNARGSDRRPSCRPFVEGRQARDSQEMQRRRSRSG
jgi:hypothetical protein